jgi:NAD(P)H dehydrogenase (quinone)
VTSSRTPVVVTGATGHVGGRVARRLADAGVPQCLIVRDPGRAPALPGAYLAPASYSDRDALRRAMEGATTVFFVSAAEAADRLSQHRNVVEVAAEVGVERMVYLSFLGARPDATFTLARDHSATEQHIREHIPRFTFLRDSLYADFVPLMVGADGVIRGPADDGRASVVARDDIAEVAAAVLLAAGTEEHDGQAYDVTGPQALTMGQLAEELSRATGRTISYHAETEHEAHASRARYGAPDWQVAGWVTTYLAIAAGELAAVSDTVPRLTGHQALGFADLLRRRPELYAHLR